MNVIITRQNFSALLIYLSFLKFQRCYRQNMFRSSNLSPNIFKITSFLLKNCKNRPALGTLPPDLYNASAAGGYALRPPHYPFSLRIPRCALNCSCRFQET